MLNFIDVIIVLQQWYNSAITALLIPQVVYNGKELNHPFGISHYRSSIFWTEYMNGSIFQLDLNSGDVNLLRSERPPLFGLRVFDAHSQIGKMTEKKDTKNTSRLLFYQSFLFISLYNAFT